MNSRAFKDRLIVRNLQHDDIDQILAISHQVYGQTGWTRDNLESHLHVFPHGQLVAVDRETQKVLGSASSLIVRWDDYDFSADEDDYTAMGDFTNHDPAHGRTLYGADVAVSPDARRMGVGKALYKARRELCRGLNLLRIRAAARLRGYHQVAGRMTPEQYTIEVINRRIADPTLSFQLSQGFRVLAVVRYHLGEDPESLGHAAIIEWINHQAALRKDYSRRSPKFGRHRAQRRIEDEPGNAMPPRPEQG